MSDDLIREIQATANLTVPLHTEVSDGDGAERLASLTLRDRRDGRAEQVQATALFALIGGSRARGGCPARCDSVRATC